MSELHKLRCRKLPLTQLDKELAGSQPVALFREEPGYKEGGFWESRTLCHENCSWPHPLKAHMGQWGPPPLTNSPAKDGSSCLMVYTTAQCLAQEGALKQLLNPYEFLIGLESLDNSSPCPGPSPVPFPFFYSKEQLPFPGARQLLTVIMSPFISCLRNHPLL